MTTHLTITLTTSIDAPLQAVATDLADPMSHPEWATEFFAGEPASISPNEVEVGVPRLGGPCRMKIDADIDRGIVDVYLAPAGTPYQDPLPVRLIRNGTGVDVLWTLGRPPGLPDIAWSEGIASMARELDNLRLRHEAA